jgi:hypothetical protein
VIASWASAAQTQSTGPEPARHLKVEVQGFRLVGPWEPAARARAKGAVPTGFSFSAELSAGGVRPAAILFDEDAASKASEGFREHAYAMAEALLLCYPSADGEVVHVGEKWAPWALDPRQGIRIGLRRVDDTRSGLRAALDITQDPAVLPPSGSLYSGRLLVDAEGLIREARVRIEAPPRAEEPPIPAFPYRLVAENVLELIGTAAATNTSSK